jgi:hypothetical protein
VKIKKHSGALTLGICIAVAIWLPAYSQNKTNSDAGYFGLGYSQITIGASTGDSGSYAVEDNLKVATCVGPEQSSDSYSVDGLGAIGPLANNGLAIGQGTSMMLSWPDARQITGIKGYEIYRSHSQDLFSFGKISDAPISIMQYEDKGLANGTYFYKVHFVNDADQSIQWTAIFSGTISATSSEDWAMYD